MKMLRFIITTAIAVALCTTLQASDSDTPTWASFRNGGQSRVHGECPASWSPEHGISWQIETDGYGQSTPVIFDDTVFITSAVGTMKQECAVTAVSISQGSTRWQYRFPASTTGRSTYMYSRGAPTPVVDRDGIYAFFESGDLVKVHHNGDVAWRKNLTESHGPFESNHGLGSSLADSKEYLFLNLEHKGPSKLVAMRKSDGSVAWQVDRPSGSSWTSPVVADDLVVVSSAGSVAAYSCMDGREQWKVDGLEGNSVPSPCVVGSRIYTGARVPEFGSAADAAKSNICIEIKENGSVKWRSKGAVCDYSSPVVDGDRAYFLNKVGVLSCLNADTGEQRFRHRLGTECWATPIVADNGIYFFGKYGVTKVIAREAKFRLLETCHLWNSDTPPKPELYVEATSESPGGHGPGHKAEHGGTDARKTQPSGPGGMIGALMKGDVNKDGILQGSELSPDFQPMLKRVDTNGDGNIDQSELSAMAKSFAERRKNSRSSSRDPIVYGVAAVPGTLVVRTGTRLYGIIEPNKSKAPSTGGTK